MGAPRSDRGENDAAFAGTREETRVARACSNDWLGARHGKQIARFVCSGRDRIDWANRQKKRCRVMPTWADVRPMTTSRRSSPSLAAPRPVRAHCRRVPPSSRNQVPPPSRPERDYSPSANDNAHCVCVTGADHSVRPPHRRLSVEGALCRACRCCYCSRSNGPRNYADVVWRRFVL